MELDLNDGYFRAGDVCGFRWHASAQGEQSGMWSVLVSAGKGAFRLSEIMWAVVDDFGNLVRVD